MKHILSFKLINIESYIVAILLNPIQFCYYHVCIYFIINHLILVIIISLHTMQFYYYYIIMFIYVIINHLINIGFNTTPFNTNSSQYILKHIPNTYCCNIIVSNSILSCLYIFSNINYLILDYWC